MPVACCTYCTSARSRVVSMPSSLGWSFPRCGLLPMSSLCVGVLTSDANGNQEVTELRMQVTWRVSAKLAAPG